MNEILATIERAGGINSYPKFKDAWRRAFEQYKNNHSGYSGKLGCGSCRRNVLSWLRKNYGEN